MPFSGRRSSRLYCTCKAVQTTAVVGSACQAGAWAGKHCQAGWSTLRHGKPRASSAQRKPSPARAQRSPTPPHLVVHYLHPGLAHLLEARHIKIGGSHVLHLALLLQRRGPGTGRAAARGRVSGIRGAGTKARMCGTGM